MDACLCLSVRPSPCVTLQRLEIVLGATSLTKTSDGGYHIQCFDAEGKAAMDVVVKGKKAPARHGNDGVVNGTPGDEMFYYCMTSCSISGSITLEGVKEEIMGGKAWYDHEFGGSMTYSEEASPMFFQYAWNWASVQLENGYEVGVGCVCCCSCC